MPLRALRGATTIEVDEVDHLTERMVELLTDLFARNDVDHDDLVSIIFTATDDIRCTFPATAARTFGLGDVPLICARELDVDGGTPMCVRVLLHLETARARDELHHVYQYGAKGLRDDLPT
jgi:chorismate mutase